jgi:tRNA(fMet)-specific endonuclease VapC
MRYVLDTTIVSALMRAERGPATRLLRESPTSVLVPQPVVAEVAYGLARLPRSRRKSDLSERFSVVLAALDRAAWTDDVSRHFGDLKAALERAGARVADFDLAVAAHAIAYEARVVTRNTRHFARVPGIACEDWS